MVFRLQTIILKAPSSIERIVSVRMFYADEVVEAIGAKAFCEVLDDLPCL
jgi:hypothetical protein